MKKSVWKIPIKEYRRLFDIPEHSNIRPSNPTDRCEIFAKTTAGRCFSSVPCGIIEPSKVHFEIHDYEVCMKTIGENIAAFRKDKKLTQEELAEIMSVTAQAISKWECNSSYPDVMVMEQLAKVLGVTVDEILHGKQEMPVLKQAEPDVIDRRILLIHVETKPDDDEDEDDKTEVNLRFPFAMIRTMKNYSFLEKLFDSLDISDVVSDNGILETLYSILENGLTGPVMDVDTNEVHTLIEVIDHEA